MTQSMNTDNKDRINVIGSSISAGRFSSLVETLAHWAQGRESKYVCVANVHMTMEAHWNESFGQVLTEADMVVPDGMPLVWMMRRLGAPHQERMAGLDLMLAMCRLAQSQNLSVYFLGSTDDVLTTIRNHINSDFPNLIIAGLESPPFRPLTKDEDAELVDRINSSGANVIFVAFGCPKQEKWMADHRGRIQGVMIGLGGAFPVYAGIVKRAPSFIRNAGFEWLFRLLQEPKRLFRRYWNTNIPFLWLSFKQLYLNR